MANSRKLTEYELTNRKSLIALSHMKSSKDILQNVLKDLTTGEQATELHAMAERGLQYDALKQQFIECSEESKNAKARVASL
jgi:hypothetical protein